MASTVELDARADDPHAAPAPRDEARHEAVPGSWTEAGADVEGAGDTVQGHPDDEEPDAQRHRRRGRDHGEGRRGGQADEQHVGERADAGALPHGDPEQQHDDGDLDDEQPEVLMQVRVEAQMEDVPGSTPRCPWIISVIEKP